MPKPPPESQRAVPMPHPITPLPMNQKPERLSTRNRRLPQIPSSTATGAGAHQQQPHTASNLTSSIFGLAKKFTSGVTTAAVATMSHNTTTVSSLSGHRPSVRQFPTAPPRNSMMRASNSFGAGPLGGQQHTLRRSGRGARLPMIPGGPTPLPPPSAAGGGTRRQLPSRGQFQSRSLDNSHPHEKLDTVLEAGRGVRKLPVPVVRTGSNSLLGNPMNAPTPYEQAMLGGGGGGGGQQPAVNGTSVTPGGGGILPPAQQQPNPMGGMMQAPPPQPVHMMPTISIQQPSADEFGW